MYFLSYSLNLLGEVIQLIQMICFAFLAAFQGRTLEWRSEWMFIVPWMTKNTSKVEALVVDHLRDLEANGEEFEVV